MTLTIHKVEEPPRLVRKTLPPPLPRPEEVALARRLLDPYAERVLKQGGEPEKVRTLEALARIEPERVLELIQQKKVFDGPVLQRHDRPASGQRPDGRERRRGPGGAGGAGRPRVEGDRVHRREQKTGRPEPRPGARSARPGAPECPGGEGARWHEAAADGQVAERFLDLGQAERGRAILREGEAMAKQLPKGGWVGYARGAFAEELVQIDLEAALALTKDLADADEFDRHHGNIAHELAGRDPAQAERVLAMVKDRVGARAYTVRVVYRMAPLDLARARRLASRSATTASRVCPGNDGPPPEPRPARIRAQRCSRAPTNRSSVRPEPARRNQQDL